MPPVTFPWAGPAPPPVRGWTVPAAVLLFVMTGTGAGACAWDTFVEQLMAYTVRAMINRSCIRLILTIINRGSLITINRGSFEKTGCRCGQPLYTTGIKYEPAIWRISDVCYLCHSSSAETALDRIGFAGLVNHIRRSASTDKSHPDAVIAGRCCDPAAVC